MMLAAASASQKDNVRFFMFFSFCSWSNCAEWRRTTLGTASHTIKNVEPWA